MSHKEDDKNVQFDHLEDAAVAPLSDQYAMKSGLVIDSLAADYIDPTVAISPEEDRRLRRKAYR